MSIVKLKLSKLHLMTICIICLVLIIVLLLVYLKSTSSKQQNVPFYINTYSNNTRSNDANPALYHSTKSVDGERQFTNDTAWKSQPSKCFDCESQLKAQCGDACVYSGTKQKLFSQN